MKNQCLLYIPEHVSEEKELYKFFYKILTAQGKDKEKIFATTGLFACNYGLFHGTVSRELYDKSIQRLKPSDSCENFIKKAPYAEMEIKEYACCLCEYSKAYRNARLQDENIILRYLLRPDTAFSHCCLLPDAMFVSLRRMATDELVGTCPIIPFNCHLYVFITINQKRKFQKEELIKEFTDYLLRNEPKLSTYSENEVHERVNVYINDIYRIPEDSCDTEHFNSARSRLDTPYTYTPPTFMTPEFSENLNKKSGSNKPKKQKASAGQVSLFDTTDPATTLSKIEVIDIPHEDIRSQNTPINLLDTYHDFYMKLSSEPKAVTPLESEPETTHKNGMEEDITFVDSECTTSKEDKYSVSTGIIEISVTEPSFDEELDLDIPQSQTETMKETVNEYHNDDNTEILFDKFAEDNASCEKVGTPEQVPLPIGTAESSDVLENSFFQSTIDEPVNIEIISLELGRNTETDIDENEADALEENKKLNAVSSCHFDGNMYVDLCADFKSNIMYLYEDILHTFTENAYKSEFISIEPCSMNQWSGLILYISYNRSYYFFDISVLTPELLCNIFKNFEGVALTFHPNIVYSMLNYYQTEASILDNLDVLAELHGCDSSSEHAILASIKESFTPNNDILACILPLYKKFYDNWVSNMPLSMAAVYEKEQKISLVMAKNLDLSSLSPALSPAYKTKGLSQYEFKFDMSQIFTQPGILIGITITNSCYTKSVLPCPFTSEIIYQLSLLHNTYISNTSILNIKNDSLFLYYTGSLSEARRFYDSYLALLQKSFMDTYKEPLQTTASCIGYGYC